MIVAKVIAACIVADLMWEIGRTWIVRNFDIYDWRRLVILKSLFSGVIVTVVLMPDLHPAFWLGAFTVFTTVILAIETWVFRKLL